MYCEKPSIYSINERDEVSFLSLAQGKHQGRFFPFEPRSLPIIIIIVIVIIIHRLKIARFVKKRDLKEAKWEKYNDYNFYYFLKGSKTNLFLR